MNRILSSAIPLLACAALGATAGEKKSPNLLFVFPDQMRAQTLGFTGEEMARTPVLDQFAREAIYFSNAISNYPVCSPTRAMLMSGQYPIHNRVTMNCTNKTEKYGCELPESTRCWSDVLKEKGYSLGYLGKWHLDSPRAPYIPTSNNAGDVKWNEWCPPSRRHGFDFWHAYGTYDQHLRPMYWDTGAPRDSFHYYDEWGPEHEANLAINYIRNKDGKFRKDGQPFALVISMNPPHPDFEKVPEKYRKIYRDVPVESLAKRPDIPPAGTPMGDRYRKYIRDYYAAITGVDEQFGRILQALKDVGVEDNTIVVFTSDHGDCLGIHEELAKNNWFEEAMRVPLLIRYPGKLKPRTDDILLSTPDISPTLLGLMGFRSSIPAETDGMDLSAYLETGKGKKPVSQWYMRIMNGDPSMGLRGVRTGRYTFVINRDEGGNGKTMLYDRKNDPYELKNLAGENPFLVGEMTGLLREWLQRYNDPWIKNLE